MIGGTPGMMNVNRGNETTTTTMVQRHIKQWRKRKTYQT